jgi:hypothetical protein
MEPVRGVLHREADDDEHEEQGADALAVCTVPRYLAFIRRPNRLRSHLVSSKVEMGTSAIHGAGSRGVVVEEDTWSESDPTHGSVLSEHGGTRLLTEGQPFHM